MLYFHDCAHALKTMCGCANPVITIVFLESYFCTASVSEFAKKHFKKNQDYIPGTKFYFTI